MLFFCDKIISRNNSMKSLFLKASLASLVLFSLGLKSGRTDYPAAWWVEIPREEAHSWEILPQDAGQGEVILSKRTELGVLSNFAATPITIDGKSYKSLEGFWQMMKYPESATDERATHPGVNWTFTREQVAQMVGFEAKRAGSLASENMELMNINWVTYQGRQLPYRVLEKGEHYQLILRATWAKLNQNPDVKRLLLKTGDLVLRPDHLQKPETPPAWKYFQIYMDIRGQFPAH
jgi:predicted NAD-dependent protein-ADP-ribosyltransferase YbiA (DUF1768 family)